MAADERSVWGEVGGERYFAFPPGWAPPPGELRLSNPWGREIGADPASVVAFQVDEAEVRRILDGQARDRVRRGVKLFTDAARVLREAAPPRAPEPQGPLAAGVRTVGDLLLGFSQTLRDATGDDPVAKARAAERMAALADAARAQGNAGLAELLADLPGKARAFADDPNLADHLRAATAELERMTAEITAARDQLEKLGRPPAAGPAAEAPPAADAPAAEATEATEPAEPTPLKRKKKRS